MSRNSMFARVTKIVVPLLVCAVAAVAAVWLYFQSPGLTGIQGVAEAREYKLAAIETGRLAAVQVDLGQRVSRGQVIARLDAGMVEQEIRVAEAELRELESFVRAQGKTLDLSGLETERSFQSDVEKATLDLRQARDDCSRVQADLSGVQQEISRQESLVERHLSSGERLHELQVRLAALKQSVTTCPSSVDALESRRKAAEARLVSWRSSRGSEAGGSSNQEQLDPLLLRSARQRESLRLLRLRLDNMVLRAPVDGLVANVIARTGDVLRPGDPVATVIEASPTQVIAYIEEERGIPVAAQDCAVLRPHDRAGAPLDGTVISVAGTVSQTPPRFWPAPNRPRWGRQVFIQISPGQNAVPGEAFDISFRRP